MQTRLPLSVVVLIFSVVLTAAQQPDPDAAKLKQQRKATLLAKIAADSEQLKLPENRAILSARLGAMAWNSDPERAKQVLQTAISELTAAQQEAELAKGKASLFQDLLNSQNIRPQVLNTIATVDPEYALESFYRTRPSAVARAMAGETDGKINDQSQMRNHLAQSEINLEQRLLRLVADKRPDRAAAMLKDNIRKRLSSETFGSLTKLYSLEPTSATELADDVLSRLSSAQFIRDGQLSWDIVNLSNSILSEHMRERGPDEKYLAFNDARIRVLSIRLLNAYTDPSNRSGYVPFEQLEPVAKRYSPQSIDKLRKSAIAGRGNPHRTPVGLNPEYDAFIKTNPSADQLVQNASRFSPDLQRQIFQNAANKFSETGQYQNAVALLNEKFEGDSLEHAVSSLNWYYGHHLIQKGEFDAAEALMLEFNESNRISGLTSLAQTIFSRNPSENKNRAANILRRVRSLMPERPENYNEMSQLFSLINATSSIEPADAFANLESQVDHLNTLIQAFAVVQGFQGGQMRQGEYSLTSGMNFGIYIEPSLFRNLANSDFDRTVSLVDSLARTELRIQLRMHLAENF